MESKDEFNLSTVRFYVPGSIIPILYNIDLKCSKIGCLTKMSNDPRYFCGKCKKYYCKNCFIPDNDKIDKGYYCINCLS